jgi:hypothetical protein
MISTLFLRLKTHSEPIFFSLLGLFFLAIPLLRNLQLESAAAVSIIATFAQLNIKIVRKSWLNRSLVYPYFSFIPLLISDLIFGCFSIDGLTFVLFLPITSALLSQQIVRINYRFSPFPLTTSLVIILWLTLGLPLIEFLQSPVVFLYNPIWGFWPGPIYDEQIAFPPQLLFYRFYIIIWAFLLYELHQKSIHTKRVLLIFSTLIVLFLNFRSIGILRTTTELGAALNQVKSRENLTIHFNQPGLDSLTAEAFLNEALFHWNDLQHELEISDQRLVQIFIYNHPWQKKELTGAKFTQYTPVWLENHQVHIDVQSFRSVIRHELVHLLAKNWSSSIINASWNMGIVEGLATAFDPDISTDYTLQEFVAAGGIPTIEEMKSLFSFWGFYSRSSSNAYYKTGAFIQFLAQTGQLSLIRTMYGSSILNQSLDAHIFEWQTYLQEIKPDSAAKKQAQIVFDRPSLFQKKCPRTISEGYQQYDQLQKAWAENDSLRAQRLMQEGSTLRDSIWNDWFRYQQAIAFMKNNKADSVLSLWENPTSTRAKMVLFDAYLLLGSAKDAISLKRSLDTLIAPENIFWTFRSDSLQSQFFQLFYKNEPKPALESSFSGLHPYLIEFIRASSQVELINELQTKLLNEPLDFQWIRSYLNWSYFLWEIGQADNARQLLYKLELLSEKPQHRYIIQRDLRLINSLFVNH